MYEAIGKKFTLIDETIEIMKRSRSYGITRNHTHIPHGTVVESMEVIMCNEDPDEVFEALDRMIADAETSDDPCDVYSLVVSDQWDEECGNDCDYMGMRRLMNATVLNVSKYDEDPIEAALAKVAPVETEEPAPVELDLTAPLEIVPWHVTRMEVPEGYRMPIQSPARILRVLGETDRALHVMVRMLDLRRDDIRDMDAWVPKACIREVE